MYDFSNVLLNGERILFQGQGNPEKGNKGVIGIIICFCFCLFVQALLIWSVVTQTGDGASGVNGRFIAIFIAIVVFECLCIYGLIYNLFLKKRKVSNVFYCLTNVRAMIYDLKKNKLVYGYIDKYNDIHCDNVKDNYGDLFMGIFLEEDSSAIKTSKEIYDLMTNPNPEDMPFINFESISNPEEVMKLVKEAKNNNIK